LSIAIAAALQPRSPAAKAYSRRYPSFLAILFEIDEERTVVFLARQFDIVGSTDPHRNCHHAVDPSSGTLLVEGPIVLAIGDQRGVSSAHVGHRVVVDGNRTLEDTIFEPLH